MQLEIPPKSEPLVTKSPDIDAQTQEINNLSTDQFTRSKSSKKLPIIFGIIICFLLLLFGISSFLYSDTDQESELSPTPMPSPASVELSPVPTVMPTAPPVVSPKPIVQPSPKATTNPSTNVPTPIPTQAPTPIPTPITRTSNPPQINVSYPSESQTITMSNGQQLCVVDSPTGGDTSGLQRKHNINNQGWSSYIDNFTLCFEPSAGQNNLTLQYRNSYGDESGVYNRQFSVTKE